MGDNSQTLELKKTYPVIAGLLIVALLIAGRDVLYPVRALWWHGKALLWWLVLVCGSMGQGALVFKLLRADPLELRPGMTIGIMTGLGLGMFSLEALLLGAFGFMNTPALTLLVLISLPVSLYPGRAEILRVLAGAGEEISDKFREAALPLGIALTTAAALLPLVILPSRAFDALSYHLEVPLRYLQAGSIVNMPENLYSYSPLLTQMLYTLGLGLDGPALAGLLYYSFFILTLLAVWRGGEKLFGNQGSAWAAALLALTPVFLVEVPQAGADWSMTFFIVSALLLVADGKRDWRRMVLAGVLAGMAAGCRHQGLGYALVLLPAAGVAVDLWGKRPVLIKPWPAFTAAALVSASPWYIKNLIQTGDPVYPLLTSLTGGLPYNVGFVDGLVGSRPLHLLWSWVLVPYQSVFDPVSLSMTATVGVLPIALAFLLPGLRKQRTGSGFLVLWIVLSFAAWHLTFRTFRYLMPVMAIGYLWLGAALVYFLREDGRKKRILKFAVCLALVINAGTFLGLTDHVNRSVAPALGTSSPERYIYENYEIFPAIDHLNRLEPPPGRVLFLGEMRGFYSAFPREVPSHNAPNRLFEMVKNGQAPSAISRGLREAGFTHILFNPAEWERMAYQNLNAPLWRLGAREKAAVGSYLRDRTDLLFNANGVSVHRISGE